MIAYHGTTDQRARRIAKEGFLPRKPSRRVWFAESRRYALGRAKTQARRASDRPVVLTCDLNLAQLRERLGARRIFHKNHIIAISAKVPVTVLPLASHDGGAELARRTRRVGEPPAQVEALQGRGPSP